MAEDASRTGSDQGQETGGYISSILDVKYIVTASKLLASVPKYFSRVTCELCLIFDEKLYKRTEAQIMYPKNGS